MDEKLKALIEAYNAACDNVEKFSAEWDALAADADAEAIATAKTNLEEAVALADAADEAVKTAKSVAAARERFKKEPLPEGKTELGIEVVEPDLYTKGGRSFMADLFASQVRNDPRASERIARHHTHEIEKYAATHGIDVEKYAVATGTLGGIIPPQYLVDMYAKASRNGRVFADQVNGKPLPDQGMSLIVPRLTQGLAAAVQATESTTAATQDPTEVDLTVPVRTIAGYSPVSRQTLERAAYSDAILFEDLIARYWAALDVQCISGSGASGQVLGVLNTSSISTSTTATVTVAAIWPKIADVIQQINSAVGGLGYVADKIIMHPRRWGFFEAALDSGNRPVFGINGTPNYAPNTTGEAAGYGQVGRMHGLPVFTDANIPTNLGAGTNEDRIVVIASPIVHLWERSDDPVTLSFEQQNGNALQTQLVAYGYLAFTAGRYPAASGVVSGAGLVPPTF